MSALSTILKQVQISEQLMRTVHEVSCPTSESVRIGVIFSSIPGWGAGIGFFRMFVRSLSLVAQEHGVVVGCVIDRRDDKVLSSLADLPGERWSILHGKNDVPALPETAAFHRIHAFVDLFNSQPWVTGVGTVAWLPDFQHVHLPRHFSAEELALRESTFQERAVRAEKVLCSSEAVAADFRSGFPDLAGKECVARFPSNLVFEPLPAESPQATLSKYHLPGSYALVANQYWSHKNHLVVLEAAARAAASGVRVPIVLTGLPLDSRDAANAPTSQLLQTIASLGLAGQVIPLGQVPYRDLIQLMRAASLIIQPSRFEGWSTIVQDAKALGRPLMCSDLPVHREQAPDCRGFFGCDDADALAQLLVHHWPALTAPWDPVYEQTRLQNHLEVAREYGRTLIEMAKSAFQLAQTAAASS